ncbi:serine hydrolase FSH [Xylariomycetidae sp. FL0641]|nr:serine hydrolase FSH [Xylariomycetidae sp. FL0641]
MASTEGYDDFHLPRILCLHGGGSNARIFRAQCRVIAAQLKGHFRLCFPDGPLPSKPGPDVDSVYRGWGPFRAWTAPSWLGREDKVSDADKKACMQLIEDTLAKAMEEDDNEGAEGPWVGVLGFSQGAKVAGSILLRQQQQLDAKLVPRFRFRFGVLMAGRGPLLPLNTLELRDAPIMALDYDNDTASSDTDSVDSEPDSSRLRARTLHVHGLKDPGLELHRRLLDDWCEEGTAALFEWNGAHRLPIKSHDVAALVQGILAVSEASCPGLTGLMNEKRLLDD